MKYIEIEKDLIPYHFEIELSNKEFGLEINYNHRFDFFTVDLYKDGVALVIGEKLVLNRPLFENVTNIDLPKIKIVPKDRANIESRITYDNLEATVFLYVGDADGFI